MAEETKDDILGDGAKETKSTKSDSSDKVGMNAEEMIERNAKEKRKVRYNDRVKLRIIKNTKYYKKGDIIEPHRVMAEQLIKEKTAEEIK